MAKIHVHIQGIGGLRLNEQIMIDIREEQTVSDILREIVKIEPELSDYIDKNILKPKPGILLLVNNIDYNIISNTNIKEFVETETKKINITIIPVNHGG